MKKKFKKCDKCNEETSHSIKKVISSKRIKVRRVVEKCNECGKTTIKNARKGTYIKSLGGNTKPKSSTKSEDKE